MEGVLVVAEGAGKGNMAGEITQIIQALFGVEAHRIRYGKLKSGNISGERVHTIEYKSRRQIQAFGKGERSEKLN